MTDLQDSPIEPFDRMTQSGGDGSDTGFASTLPDSTKTIAEVDPKVKAYILRWIDRIKAAKKHHEKAFKKMRKCQEIAADGADADWNTDDKRYIVAIVNRMINIAVSQLYARNPTAQAKRKERMMYTVWDGNLSSLREAFGQMQAVQQEAAMQGMADAQKGLPPQPENPQLEMQAAGAQQVIADADQVKQYDILMDGIGKTLKLLLQHYLDDPAEQYKQLLKKAVRAAKTNGVSYAKLSFQRVLEKLPDVTAKIDEHVQKIATVERLVKELDEKEIQEGQAALEELKTTLEALQADETVIVKEGPFLTFPKVMNVIPDPKTWHLKTWLGADWIAEEMDLTPDEIYENWQVDVGDSFTPYKPTTEDDWQRWSEVDGTLRKTNTAHVYRIMSKKSGTEFVVCEGYPGYLQEPAPPKIRLPRFYDIYPLVFNEVEHDGQLYPPSDVWLARHLQSEYNRTREFLREHRMANRPAYITAAGGGLEEEDYKKLQSHETGEVIPIQGLQPGTKVGDLIQGKPVMQIDPKQYEVEGIFSDMQRVLGTQNADLGTPEDSTATEASIAEEGRQTSIGDSRDDLDDWLSLIVGDMGRVMLREMSPETVKAIVGPGARWPTLPQTRMEVAETISLEIKAGASGRPNQAADLAKLERAMPYVLQLPGVNPIPVAQRYMDTLELDMEDTIIEGLPSINAINAQASRPPAPEPGVPPGNAGAPAQPPGARQPPPGANAPNQQGPQGANNAPKPAGATPPGQPGYPAPGRVIHFNGQGNPHVVQPGGPQPAGA